MSRKSRYVEQVQAEPKIKKWRAGGYIRLSKEDKKKKDFNSLSVAHQKQLINHFLRSHPEIELVDYFIDDGYTGTDLDRPHFQRLQRMYESGQIDCIIIKDLSRLARNNEETNRLLRVMFPFFRIRFISINDKVDTYEKPESVESLDIKFKSMMHDEYARENSKKVKEACDLKRRQGLFLGGYAPYGYKKNPDNIRRLVVDEEIAWVIRYIYQEFIKVQNIDRIAKELTRKGVLPPYAYKKSKGMNYYNTCGVARMEWSATTIKTILTSDVYIGNVTQGKHKVVSYKNQRMVTTPKEEWITVEGMHEAIISKGVFMKVQGLMKTYGHKKKKKPQYSILTGYVRCGHCGRALTSVKRSQKHLSLYCAGMYSVIRCGYEKRIKQEVVEEAVLAVLNQYLKLNGELNDVIKKIQQASNSKNGLINQKNDFEERMKIFQQRKEKLYALLKEGGGSKEEYIIEREKIDRLIAEAELREKRAKNERLNRFEYLFEENDFLKNFAKYKAFKRLTRGLMETFIEKIEIYSGERIVIHLNFIDQFEELIHFLVEEKLLDNPTAFNM